jgi:hypothetical protein
LKKHQKYSKISSKGSVYQPYQEKEHLGGAISMLNDRTERRSYRKSPGRQYGYEYDPLHEQRRTDTSALKETWNSDGSRKPSRPGGTLAPRPDPRRTRQLMRQNILASKSHSAVLDPAQEADPLDQYEPPNQERNPEIYPRADGALRNRGRHVGEHVYTPERYRDFEEEQIAQDWIRHGESLPDYMDPDLGLEEDPLEERVRQAPPRPRERARPTEVLDEEEEDALLEAELEEKRRQASRRKFLVGAVVVGGTALAAYEILPRIPQAIGSGAANIEHQLQQAFTNGVTAGGNAVRKDLINALDDLEGFSLEAAIDAAKLTRIAYDVFISPLVTLASEVAGDFLTVTLDALITGRGWLAQINEDSPTLAALQRVLQSWVDLANEMPKKVQVITETDLDGAQSYLRALQREIQQQQALLNAQATPTPASHTTPVPTPHQEKEAKRRKMRRVGAPTLLIFRLFAKNE